MLQLQLPGMEECNFQCLTNCPMELLGKDCLWDDPLIGMFDEYQYPEFFFWRVDHEDECGIKHTEPGDPMQTRCPRCLSIEVVIGYPYIECRHCGYNEPLIDFPISRYYHLALEKMFNDRSLENNDINQEGLQ